MGGKASESVSAQFEPSLRPETRLHG